jgi:hypothetical protein
VKTKKFHAPILGGTEQFILADGIFDAIEPEIDKYIFMEDVFEELHIHTNDG